jgi:hypothetical protein
MNYFYVFCGKKVGLGNFGHFVTIEDFRLNIEYLRSASLRAVGSAIYEPEAGGINY